MMTAFTAALRWAKYQTIDMTRLVGKRITFPNRPEIVGVLETSSHPYLFLVGRYPFALCQGAGIVDDRTNHPGLIYEDYLLPFSIGDLRRELGQGVISIIEENDDQLRAE